MKIPFIVSGKGLDSTRGRMFWQLFEIRIPGWVNRPVHFECTPDPIEKFLLALFFGRFGSVMQAAQSDALLHQFAELLQMLILQCWMALAAITVDHNRCGAIKGIGVRSEEHTSELQSR